MTDDAYRPTALELTDAMPLEAWLDLCRSLGAMAAGHQWWIGDALVYGEERYGEESAQGESELGLAPQTALNYRYVASRLEPRRRRSDLTWSHHAEVARLSGEAQERCLAIAVEEAWNVRQLRDYVAITYPQSQPKLFGEDDGRDDLTDRENTDVQKRVERISRELEAGADIDRSDVAWLLELVKRLTRGRT